MVQNLYFVLPNGTVWLGFKEKWAGSESTAATKERKIWEENGQGLS